MQCIFVRRSMIVLLIAFLAQAIHCQVPAGEQPHIAGKPVTAVASFAGYTAMMDDIKMIEHLTDNPKLRTMITASVAMATGGEGLTGLDHRRPWGLAVYGLTRELTGRVGWACLAAALWVVLLAN